MKCCLVVGERSFSPAKPPRSSPPGAVLFCRALEHQRRPALTLNASFEDEALRAVDRERGIGVAGQQAGKHDRAPGAISLRNGTASRVNGASRILAKIRS